jgi:MoaA/NifB/PqqE/SkfB family radical SAM enzyme
MSHFDETVKRLGEWFISGRPQLPTKVDMFFTESCNLRCKFCNYSRKSVGAGKEMSDDEITRLVGQVCGMSAGVFGVLGGEPFLRKDVLLRSMENVRKARIDGSIVTNGTLLDDADIERIVKMDWNLVRLSIDGTKTSHESLRGAEGSFDKVTSALSKIHDCKARARSVHPTVEINFVLTNSNYKDLADVVRMAAEKSVNFIYVLPLIELTEQSKELKIGESEAAAAKGELVKAAELAKKLGVRTNLDEVISGETFLLSNEMASVVNGQESSAGCAIPACLMPWYAMNVTAEGIATPCAQWPKEDGVDVIGRNLTEVWFGDFEKFRKRIGGGLSGWCERCCMPLVDENRELKRALSG